jgi:hypothetical protein
VDPDRLDRLCARDMAVAAAAAEGTAESLDRVSALVGPETWTGPPADRWSSEFLGRRGGLNRFFAQLAEERLRLLQQARDQAAQHQTA